MAEMWGSEATQEQHQPFPSTPEAVERPNKTMMGGRVEIDTSPPFGSVKEAVSHFEERWRSLWVPLQLLHHPHQLPRDAYTMFDINKVEEEAAELEKDLSVKEQETLHVLKELEAVKKVVEELKLSLQKEVPDCNSTPQLASKHKIPPVPPTPPMGSRSPVNITKHGLSSVDGSSPCATPPPNFILMELKQAKSNLSRTTNDLAEIRASVESLNEKIVKEKASIGKTQERIAPNNVIGLPMSPLKLGLDPINLNLEAANEAEMQGSSANLHNISMELQQLNFAAEQFIKMAEASKSEVLRAMSEIENTKKSMKTAEMRWVAAKKMEEAAKAVEAVALAEMKCLANIENPLSAMPITQNSNDGITLSFEEYTSLTDKARKADELSRKRAIDAMFHMDEESTAKLAMLKELGITTDEVEFSKRALEEALNRVEVSNTAKFHPRDGLRHWRPENGQRMRLVHNSARPRNSFPNQHHHDSRVLFDANRSNLIDYKSKPVLRPSISLKDILGRKQVQPEDLMVRNQRDGHANRNTVSLSEMLQLQRDALPASSTEGENQGIDHRQFLAQRKKFGFIHISLPLTKQGRRKMQASNSRSHNA